MTRKFNVTFAAIDFECFCYEDSLLTIYVNRSETLFFSGNRLFKNVKTGDRFSIEKCKAILVQIIASKLYDEAMGVI